MDRFGFEITKGRQIDWDSNDRSIADYIREREPSFKVCIACGSLLSQLYNREFYLIQLKGT